MSKDLIRIRLLADHLKTLTGTFGMYEFENGVSTQPLPRREAERLSVITKVEFIDAETMWQRKSRERGEVSASTLKKPTKIAKKAEEKEKTKAFTREQLESVADSKGLAGLREIGDSIGVKGVSIRQLIDGILEAQG